MIFLFHANKSFRLRGNVQFFIHVEDLQDKDGKGNPAARQRGKGKVGEERPDAIWGRSCQDEDGCSRVENEVEDGRCQMQHSTPLSSSLSKDGDREGLPQDTLHQICKSYIREEPFEEHEDDKRGGQYKWNWKGGCIKARVDPKAIFANSRGNSRRAKTTCAEEGGQYKDQADLRNHRQLLAESRIAHLVLPAKGEKVLSGSLGYGHEGAGERGDGNPCLEVVFRTPDEGKEDDGDLESGLELRFPAKFSKRGGFRNSLIFYSWNFIIICEAETYDTRVLGPNTNLPCSQQHQGFLCLRSSDKDTSSLEGDSDEGRNGGNVEEDVRVVPDEIVGAEDKTRKE